MNYEYERARKRMRRSFGHPPTETESLSRLWVARMSLWLLERDRELPPSVLDVVAPRSRPRTRGPYGGPPAARPSAPRPPAPTMASIRRALLRMKCQLEDRPPARDGGVFRVVEALGALARLTALEVELLLFAFVFSMHHLGDELPERPVGEHELRLLLAAALAVDARDIAIALAPTAALRGGGLLKLEPSPSSPGVGGALVPTTLVEKVLRAGIAPEAVIDHLVPRSPAATCTLADFTHLDEDLELVTRHLDRTLAGENSRLLILLHGASGVGKSELVRALAAAQNARLHEVRFEDEDGDPLDAENRLLAFRLVQRLLARAGRVIVVFEEMEDLFPVHSNFFGPVRESADRKAFTNRTLEEATVVSFFVTNEIAQIDPAVLRRFDYAIEMRTPPRSARLRIVTRHVAGLPARTEWIERVAERADLTPADVERAARFVRGLAFDDADRVERALDRALAQGAGKRPVSPSRIEDRVMRYDLAAARTSIPLEPVIDGLRRRGRGTVLFSGAPGTGKTEAAHEVARKLERPLVARAASSLLSKYVGDTEKRLAAAFAEARDEGAVLLLDEVDSFLSPRGKAVHSWEVTQVNEMLVQIERFHGVLICTTNFLDGLDPAALRRFAIKVQFEPPGPEQRWSLFVAALGALELPVPDDATRIRAALAAFPSLAPGHFATAVRHAQLTDGVADASALLDRIAAEHAHEPSASRRAGFA